MLYDYYPKQQVVFKSRYLKHRCLTALPKNRGSMPCLLEIMQMSTHQLPRALIYGDTQPICTR